SPRRSGWSSRPAHAASTGPAVRIASIHRSRRRVSGSSRSRLRRGGGPGAAGAAGGAGPGGGRPPPAATVAPPPPPPPRVGRRAAIGEAVPAAVAGQREVGGLVPLVARALEGADEVAIGVGREVLVHRLGAAGRERAARLELELVPGDVVRAQLEHLRDVGGEVAGVLARDGEEQ